MVGSYADRLLSFMVSLALSAFSCILDYHINRLWGTGVKFGQATVFHCYVCSMSLFILQLLLLLGLGSIFQFFSVAC